jgi:hypothetical protein
LSQNRKYDFSPSKMARILSIAGNKLRNFVLLWDNTFCNLFPQIHRTVFKFCYSYCIYVKIFINLYNNFYVKG